MPPLRPRLADREPGISIPGEMGIRHEDVIFITEAGAGGMTPWSGSAEQPAVV